MRYTALLHWAFACSGTGQEKRGECGPLEAKKDGELPSKSFWS